MRQLRAGLVLACALTVPGNAPATAESAPEDVRDTLMRLPPADPSEPSAVDFLDFVDVREMANDDAIRVASASRTLRTTADHQIVLELSRNDLTDANLFDLRGRTVVFTPDGQGGYRRSVQRVAWERNIGGRVASDQEVSFRGFQFEFAGRSWSSFFVSPRGVITFGRPLQYDYVNTGFRFETMQQLNHLLVNETAISALYKPLLGGFYNEYGATQHVAHQADRVVVTWTTNEPVYYVHGVAPRTPTRFQAILASDGSVRLNYDNSISFSDGIVGLLGPERRSRGAVITELGHSRNPGLPGHLDLLNVTLQQSGTGGVIVEFTLREPPPMPPRGHLYAYRLFFDVEQPWWTNANDLDFDWRFYVTDGGLRLASGTGVAGVVETTDTRRIALLANITGLEGTPVAVFANAAHFASGRYVEGDSSGQAVFRLPTSTGPDTDLSEATTRSAQYQYEVFNYPTVRNLDGIACHLTNSLGDEFDLLVFHNQFRIDKQEATTPFSPYFGNDPVDGIGRPATIGGPPCDAKRLKGRWASPVWIYSDQVYRSGAGEGSRYDYGLWLFAHEFSHMWLAYVSRNRNGESVPLVGDGCLCHWQAWLHAPAAFPWHPDQDGARSLMGGRDWRDNGDGTFTPYNGVWNGGFSWLDLYLMGLADVGEVPDFFILRDPRQQSTFRYAGVRENVSIQQVLDVHGLRSPSPAQAQKDFNAGFVYLVEPGTSPERDGLAVHARFRDRVGDYWSHITGGRSRFSANVSTTEPEPEPEPDPVPREPCEASDETLCLHDGRYEVKAKWWTDDAGTSPAVVVPKATKNSGLLRFFDANNWEILIKVLDGCSVNDHHWVYAASTTDLGYSIVVTDTATGAVREYTNEPGQPAPAITDATAFPRACSVPVAAGASAAPIAPAPEALLAASHSGCEEAGSSLCLVDGRFEVKVDWSTADGQNGPASMVPGGTNNSGLFTFFDANNWEMLIKVLDGCAVNGNFWVYSAAATDLGLDITVTDTDTDATWRYTKEPGPPAPAITDAAAFTASCRP
ncbi:MAG: hypothetical protein F4172_10140 [Holophagales bacterium]|nr:hypothetical protein [Holophagales bacterium]MYG30839.1 hypothetical protein [Holophagales bacterium]